MPTDSAPDALPRPINSEEREILLALLAADFAGATQLREQVDQATVTSNCPCGCPTIDIEVPASGEGALVIERVPVMATIEGTNDSILLFVDAGRISRLEYAAIDEPPLRWPSAARLTVTPGC